MDSDIVVLALRFFDALGLSELCVGFGTGNKYRDIPVHSLHAGLGTSMSISLTMFHSLTECDTTSQFLGCGEKTAWAVWTNFPHLTDAREDASAIEAACDALPSANAKADALTTKAGMTSK